MIAKRKKLVKGLDKETKKILKQITGFDYPKRNYFWCPKSLDFLMPFLNGNELKVLLYIIRHTWGYNKEEDVISWSQFQNGIISRDGKDIDYGTGLPRTLVYEALKGLLDLGIIVKKSNKGRACTFSLRYHIPVRNPELPRSESRTTPVRNPEPTIIDYNSKYTIADDKDLEKQKAAVRKLKEHLTKKLGFSFKEK